MCGIKLNFIITNFVLTAVNETVIHNLIITEVQFLNSWWYISISNLITKVYLLITSIYRSIKCPWISASLLTSLIIIYLQGTLSFGSNMLPSHDYWSSSDLNTRSLMRYRIIMWSHLELHDDKLCILTVHIFTYCLLSNTLYFIVRCINTISIQQHAHTLGRWIVQ